MLFFCQPVQVPALICYEVYPGAFTEPSQSPPTVSQLDHSFITLIAATRADLVAACRDFLLVFQRSEAP